MRIKAMHTSQVDWCLLQVGGLPWISMGSSFCCSPYSPSPSLTGEGYSSSCGHARYILSPKMTLFHFFEIHVLSCGEILCSKLSVGCLSNVVWCGTPRLPQLPMLCLRWVEASVEVAPAEPRWEGGGGRGSASDASNMWRIWGSRHKKNKMFVTRGMPEKNFLWVFSRRPRSSVRIWYRNDFGWRRY